MKKVLPILHSLKKLAPKNCNNRSKLVISTRNFASKESRYNWGRHEVKELPTIGVVGAPCSKGQVSVTFYITSYIVNW